MRRSGAPWLRRSVSGSTSVGRSGPRPLSRLCCVARRSPADSHQRVGRKHVPRWREGEVVTPHSQGDPSAVSVSHPPLGGTVRWAMASETLTGRHRVSSQAAGVAPTRGTKSTPGDCGGVGPGANARQAPQNRLRARHLRGRQEGAWRDHERGGRAGGQTKRYRPRDLWKWVQPGCWGSAACCAKARKIPILASRLSAA